MKTQKDDRDSNRSRQRIIGLPFIFFIFRHRRRHHHDRPMHIGRSVGQSASQSVSQSVSCMWVVMNVCLYVPPRPFIPPHPHAMQCMPCHFFPTAFVIVVISSSLPLPLGLGKCPFPIFPNPNTRTALCDWNALPPRARSAQHLHESKMSPICQGRKRFQGQSRAKHKNKTFDLWLRDPYCSDAIHRPRIRLSAGDEITIC